MNIDSAISDKFHKKILEVAENAKKSKDWQAAYANYHSYLIKAFANVFFPTDEFDFQYVPVLFSYGECLLEIAKDKKKLIVF